MQLYALSIKPINNSEIVFNILLLATIISVCSLIGVLIGRRFNGIIYFSLLSHGLGISCWLAAFSSSIIQIFPHPLLFIAPLLFFYIYSIFLKKYYSNTALGKAITAYNEIKRMLSVGDYAKFPNLPRIFDTGFYGEKVKIGLITFEYLRFFDEKSGKTVQMPIIDVYDSGHIECKDEVFVFRCHPKQSL